MRQLVAERQAVSRRAALVAEAYRDDRRRLVTADFHHEQVRTRLERERHGHAIEIVSRVNLVRRELAPVPEDAEGAAAADPRRQPPADRTLASRRNEAGSEPADLGFRTQQGAEVQKTVGKSGRGAAPAHLSLHALVSLGRPDGRGELGFWTVSGQQPGLALVVEWPEHEPAIHVAKASNLRLGRVQIAAAKSRVGPQRAGVGARCRRQGQGSFGASQCFFDVQRIGAVPAAPDTAQRSVHFRAARAVQLV
jgi:hypothetical protein